MSGQKKSLIAAMKKRLAKQKELSAKAEQQEEKRIEQKITKEKAEKKRVPKISDVSKHAAEEKKIREFLTQISNRNLDFFETVKTKHGEDWTTMTQKDKLDSIYNSLIKEAGSPFYRKRFLLQLQRLP